MTRLLIAGLVALFAIVQAGCAARSVGMGTSATKMPRAEQELPAAAGRAPQTSAIDIQRPPIPEPMVIPADSDTTGDIQPELPPPAPPAAPTGPPATGQKLVVANLISAADRYESDGDFSRAAASIERGLRISPKDARLWQRLAQLRLQQHQLGQAELTAKKSNALARGDHVLVARNWEIIASSRELRGDQKGAEFAAAKASQYRPR